MPSPKKLLIIGCGDIGQRTARLARQSGWQVSGLVRSAESGRKLCEQGIGIIEANLLDPAALPVLDLRGSSLLYLAPPPGGGVTDPKVRNLCAAIHSGQEPDKIVYISTSGVYGDCQGTRVTEATPPNPQTARAKRRFDAETVFSQFSEQRNVPLVILRVTGIYGPHRFPLQRLLERHPVLCEAEASFTNRIHADDLAGQLFRILRRLGQLDPAALAPAPGMDLGLDHHRKLSQAFGNFLSLVTAEGNTPFGDGNIVFSEQLLCLKFVYFH